MVGSGSMERGSRREMCGGNDPTHLPGVTASSPERGGGRLAYVRRVDDVTIRRVVGSARRVAGYQGRSDERPTAAGGRGGGSRGSQTRRGCAASRTPTPGQAGFPPLELLPNRDIAAPDSVWSEVRIRHVGAVAEGLIRSFVAEPGEGTQVRRVLAGAAVVVDRLEPEKASCGKRRIIRFLDDAAPFCPVGRHGRNIGKA